jgi:hypothetical protein
MMILVAMPWLADSSAPRQHARAWACDDKKRGIDPGLWKIGAPLEFGDARIEPGGLISGDMDGFRLFHARSKKCQSPRRAEKRRSKYDRGWIFEYCGLS